MRCVWRSEGRRNKTGGRRKRVILQYLILVEIIIGFAASLILFGIFILNVKSHSTEVVLDGDVLKRRYYG
jgi:hypothetical protein